jgi:Putative peptidoglycan binding domain
VLQAEVTPSLDDQPRAARGRRALAWLPTVLLALALAAALVVPARAATGGAGQFEAEAPATATPADEPPVPVGDTPFDRQGMWIWYVSHSEGGSIPAILARARQHDIGTVYVKSSDGGGYWSQFNRSLVQRLHRGGLDVCAWQFVYGKQPVAEARMGALAVKRGADCLVIDAEADYEGRYASADRYIRSLRARIGESFPLSLAGFPYVDYHPAYPYSVFLGPGGAQYNQPQMYWKTIGVSVRAIYEHTYDFNRIWERPIYPLGQTYEGPGKAGLRLFRRFAASYGSGPPSWWSWQETSGQEWGALGASAGDRPLTGYRLEVEHPLLKSGDRGDLVVWAQEHLIGAGAELTVDGVFSGKTRAAVRAFQTEQGLPATGRIDTDTWEALLAYAPYRMPWASQRTRGHKGAAARLTVPHRPLSASLPAKGYEIPPRGGAG